MWFSGECVTVDEVSSETSAGDTAYPSQGDEEVREFIAIATAGAECLVSPKAFVLLLWISYPLGDIPAHIPNPGGQVVGREPGFL
jgi:hypothetical protein